MPDFRAIPVPGSARARLLDAGIARFQELGYEQTSVVDVARDAGVTTGSLYHHFKNKLGLYVVIRDEMETRMTERMEGAAAALGTEGRYLEGRYPEGRHTEGRFLVQTGLEVAFDAAVRFGVTRILGEPRPDDRPDTIEDLLKQLLPASGLAAGAVLPAGAMLAAAWRAALLAVADGTSPAAAKDGLHWVLNMPAAA